MKRCIERARHGNNIAIETLINKLKTKIFRMAIYYSNNSGEDPDDLYQEGLIGVLEALPNINTEIGVPEQYLLKHARWNMLDSIRSQKRSHYLQLPECFDEIQEAVKYDIDHTQVSTYEFHNLLTNAQRKIVDHLLEGFTWREIGSIMGCSSANIAYHMKKIREIYRKWDESESLQEVNI